METRCSPGFKILSLTFSKIENLTFWIFHNFFKLALGINSYIRLPSMFYPINHHFRPVVKPIVYMKFLPKVDKIILSSIFCK